MAAKRIRVSDDDGANFYTLPGNTGEYNNEAGQLDDTIFGQDFSSTQPGLNGWTVSANGLYKGFAGYLATIKKSGTPTTTTGEAMTLVSGKTYQVTNSAKRLMDRTVVPIVKDNAVDHTSDVESYDYLNGTVTFKSAFTPTTPITMDYTYLPTAVVGCSNEFTLTQSANANDNTCMDTAQGNDGNRTFEYGLKTVSLQLNGIYKSANGFKDLLINRDELIIEINPDGTGKNVARGYFRAVTTGQSGDVGDLEAETITFNLSVPDDAGVVYPFHWYIAASSNTLNVGIQKCLAAWEASDLITVQYLADGTNGIQGDAVITDLTLKGGLEAMNEFTVNFQGSGETTDVP
jgi:hypothetical protein